MTFAATKFDPETDPDRPKVGDVVKQDEGGEEFVRK